MTPQKQPTTFSYSPGPAESSDRYQPPPTVTRPRGRFSPSFAKIKLMAAGVLSRQVANYFDNGGAQAPCDVPRRSHGDQVKKEQRQARIHAAPRPLPLKQRQRLMSAKCRSAGARSPMALALSK
jgi:hypothetical protein